MNAATIAYLFLGMRLAESSAYNIKKQVDHRSVVAETTSEKNQLIRILDNKKAYEDTLKSYGMTWRPEDFAKYLNKQSDVPLSSGSNDVGTFDIIVEHNDYNNVSDPEIGSIQSVDGGTFVGVYQRGITSVAFDSFENATVHAFAATWDVRRRYEPGVTRPEECLHVRIGRGFNQLVLNVEEYLYMYDTQYIGFVDDYHGFRSLEIFSPESKGKIDFSMHEVTLSTAQPRAEDPVGSLFVVIESLADDLTSAFMLSGFFGENGFFQEVILGTIDFFSIGLWSKVLGRYASSVVSDTATGRDDLDNE